MRLFNKHISIPTPPPPPKNDPRLSQLANQTKKYFTDKKRYTKAKEGTPIQEGGAPATLADALMEDFGMLLESSGKEDDYTMLDNSFILTKEVESSQALLNSNLLDELSQDNTWKRNPSEALPQRKDSSKNSLERVMEEAEETPHDKQRFNLISPTGVVTRLVIDCDLQQEEEYSSDDSKQARKIVKNLRQKKSLSGLHVSYTSTQCSPS